MKQIRRFSILPALAAAMLGLALWTPSVRACNIPVFRYALERWEPYPYETLVFYDQTLPEPLRQTFEALENRPVNLSVWLVDINQEDMHEELKKVWAREKSRAVLPWGVVRYPYPYWNNVKTNTLWTGTVEPATLWQLVDSPARRTVAEHILKGVSTVWIFIEGDDPSENDAKADILRKRLDWVRQVAELPDIAIQEVEQGEMAKDAPGHVPLKIAFEIVRLQRDDPAEQFLIHALLNIEKDYKDFKDKPFAFPIFGQGRALWGLIGDGIADAMIDDASAFLLGACSCTIKDLNPGVDMLIQADWYGGVSNLLSVASEAPTLSGMAPPPETAADGETAEPETAPELPLGLVVGGTLAILLVVVALISIKALKQNNT